MYSTRVFLAIIAVLHRETEVLVAEDRLAVVMVGIQVVVKQSTAISFCFDTSLTQRVSLIYLLNKIIFFL